MIPSLQILVGDALEKLRELPDESVHCCVTSPPYWGLRDYGTASWEGGESDCDHLKPPTKPRCDRPNHSGCKIGDGGPTWDAQEHAARIFNESCGKCGAKRIDAQLGLEKTPEEYVAKMVEIFREVRRVLRKDGTLWLNLGDTYSSGGRETQVRDIFRDAASGKQDYLNGTAVRAATPPGLKPKDIVGIPWRCAFALQADGWYLRSDIIWSKPNPMPESVTDRPTKAHEYMFLLAKSPRYFYDAEAIKEKDSGITGGRQLAAARGDNRYADGFKIAPERSNGDHSLQTMAITGNRNKRSVWTVATAPYPEAHFATYPPDLIKPCIMAGTSAKGCCAKCGAPWERIVEKSGGTTGKSWHNHENDLGRGQRGGDDGNVAADAWSKGDYKVETLGWQPTCRCKIAWQRIPEKTIPCTVLDPFAGSGTTGAVALELGRSAILIELNPKYAELIEERCCVTVGLPM